MTPQAGRPAHPGKRIREVREAKDLSVRDLARRAGCHGATLFAIESGRRTPSRDLAERLADALDLDDDDYRSLVEKADLGSDLTVLIEGGSE